MSIKRAVATVVVALGSAICISALAQVPAGYPPQYSKIVDDAKKEGKVQVLSTTDPKEVASLIKDFNVLYPAIKVEYTKMNSSDLYNKVNNAGHDAPADVLWSSAMDLQAKLASDGHGLPYKTPELAALPSWAVMNDTAYGTTYEPIVLVYNKRLLGNDVPTTRAELVAMLNKEPEKLEGKITTYDVEKGVGFLFMAQDVREDPKFWEMVKSFGASDVDMQVSTDKMIDRVASGANLIAYNVIGSYALARAKKDPALGVAFLKDYTVVLSRVMLISKDASHPNAAKLWMDYVLSKRGQTIIANDAQMYAVRQDVVGETTAAGLAKQLGATLRPIALSPMLLRYLDQGRKQALLKEWKDAATKK